MKTQEELNQLKQEYESLTAKLSELSEDELNQVTGGGLCMIPKGLNDIPGLEPIGPYVPKSTNNN